MTQKNKKSLVALSAAMLAFANTTYAVSTQEVASTKIGWSALDSYAMGYVNRHIRDAGTGPRIDENGMLYMSYNDNLNLIFSTYNPATHQWQPRTLGTLDYGFMLPSVVKGGDGLYVLTAEATFVGTYAGRHSSVLYHLNSVDNTWSKVLDVYHARGWDGNGPNDLVEYMFADPNGNLHILYGRMGWWSYGYAQKEQIYNTTTHSIGDLHIVSNRVSGSPDNGRNVPTASGDKIFIDTNQNLFLPLWDGDTATYYAVQTTPPDYSSWVESSSVTTGYGGGRSMVQDTQGHTHAVMTQDSGNLLYQYDGDSPVAIPNTPTVYGADIAVKDGNIYVIYSLRDDAQQISAGNLYLIVKDSVSNNWSTPQQITFETAYRTLSDGRKMYVNDFSFSHPFGYKKNPNSLYLAYMANDGTLNGLTYSNATLHVLKIDENKIPDFSVTGITLIPSSPATNTTFTTKVTVKNEGAASGDAGKLVIWTDQNAVQACKATGDKSVSVGMLAAGASKTLTLTGLKVASAGAKAFRAFVDANCATAESDENNNQLTASYRVKANAPDFLATSVTLNPAVPSANSSFTATVTVSNQGTTAADAGYLDVWANTRSTVEACGDEGDAWVDIGTLEAGTTKSFQVTLPAGVAGTKTLRTFIDSWCETLESNEINNQFTTGYKVK